MNMRSLAAYERARRALRGVCEPSDIRRRVRFLVRESAPSFKVSARNGGAEIRTQPRKNIFSGWNDPDGVAAKQKCVLEISSPNKIREFAIRRTTRRITQDTAFGGMRTRAVESKCIHLLVC